MDKRFELHRTAFHPLGGIDKLETVVDEIILITRIAGANESIRRDREHFAKTAKIGSVFPVSREYYARCVEA